MIRRVLDALYLGAGYLAGLFLIAIFLLMMALSIGREVGINLKSGDDITSWCMAAMAFLGLAHTFKSGEMIRVGLLTERLTGRTKWITELFALLMAALFAPVLHANAQTGNPPQDAPNDGRNFVAEHAEVARMHRRIGAADRVLVVDGRQIEETLVDDLEEMVGVDRPHDLQRRRLRAAFGNELRRLSIKVDVGD